MTRFFLFISAFILFNACSNESTEQNDRIAALEKEKNELLSKEQEKDSTINSFISSFNLIQDNLSKIKEKQRVISDNSQDKELQKTNEEQIIADIELIHQLMESNKSTIAELNNGLSKANKNLKGANIKIAELEKMLAKLSQQIAEKDVQIAELHDELSTMNQALRNLFQEYNDRITELEVKDTKLNTAHYAFGTAKELQEQGVITKEGGFIGLGKIAKLKEDFNRSYFTTVDITLTESIPLHSKKAKVVTIHPSDSYELSKKDERIDQLIIKDYEAFWSASKYLVIVVE